MDVSFTEEVLFGIWKRLPWITLNFSFIGEKFQFENILPYPCSGFGEMHDCRWDLFLLQRNTVQHGTLPNAPNFFPGFPGAEQWPPCWYSNHGRRIWACKPTPEHHPFSFQKAERMRYLLKQASFPSPPPKQEWAQDSPFSPEEWEVSRNGSSPARESRGLHQLSLTF